MTPSWRLSHSKSSPRLARRGRAIGSLRNDLLQVPATKGEQEAHQLSNRLATVLVPFLALLCLLGTIFAPAVVDLMFPGYGEVEGKRELTVELTRIMMPFLLFMALAAKAMGVLNSKGFSAFRPWHRLSSTSPRSRPASF